MKLDFEFMYNALAERFDTAYLDDLEQDELQALYEEIEEEDKLAEFLPEELENFKNNSLITQKQLLESIRCCRADYAKEATSQTTAHSLAFYQALDHLLEEFQQKIGCTILPEPLPDWWSYSYRITADGIQLALNHYEWSCDGNEFLCRCDEKLNLLNVSANRLTVAEFAQLYGIEVVTVRQWIRRGKIRSAIKAGKEWRIPELAEVSQNRTYEACRYNWADKLVDLPEKYAFLNQFKSALFSKDEEAADRYIVALDLNNADNREYISKEDLIAQRIGLLRKNPELQLNNAGEILMSRKEREELELYMISNPLVYCKPYTYEFYADDCFAEIGKDYCSMLICVTPG